MAQNLDALRHGCDVGHCPECKQLYDHKTVTVEVFEATIGGWNAKEEKTGHKCCGFLFVDLSDRDPHDLAIRIKVE